MRTAGRSTGAALAAVGAVLMLAAPIARGAGIGGVVPDQRTGTPSPRAVPSFPGASLDYQGGPVMHTNRTHVIFWNPPGSGLSFDAGYKELIVGFLQNVAADSHKATNAYALSGQYGDIGGRALYDSTFAGAIDDAQAAPTTGNCTLPSTPSMGGTGPTLPDGSPWPVCLTMAQLAAEISRVVSTQRLPTGLGDLYFLVTPDGFGSCFHAGPDSCSLGGAAVPGSFCGFHSTAGPSGSQIVYANMPYTAVPPHCRADNPRPNGSTADPTVSVISHEHNEAITDPQPGPGTAAWQNPGGIENGDLCGGNFGPNLGGSGGSTAFNQAIGTGHYFTQEEWSNEDAGGSTSPSVGCAARDESDSLNFSSNAPRRPGSPVTFSGGGSDPDGSIVSTSWDFGDGSAAATSSPVSHAYSASGAYQVTMSTVDIGGQQASVTKQITADVPPSASFSALPSKPVVRQGVRFNGSGSTDSDGSIVSYRWSFGDGSAAAAGATPTHTFAHGGRFTAVLTVTDNLGVSSTSSRTITVAPLPHVSTSVRGHSLRVVVNEAGTVGVGSKRKRVTRPGTVTFALRLSRHQRSRLNSGHAVKLKLTITFVPRVGPRLTRKLTIALP